MSRAISKRVLGSVWFPAGFHFKVCIQNVFSQTRDGVYTLCAMTSGMKRNWVHAVLKNVRPTLTR